jgi:hypothetical protein
MTQVECTVGNAPKFWKWINERGGLAVWNRQDLENAGRSFTTPLLQEDGSYTEKPHWSTGSKPDRIETDPSKVLVFIPEEVRRIRVAVKRCGLSYILTDASKKKLKAAVDKAGPDAYFEFDYETQQAVIFNIKSKLSLQAWRDQH